MGVTAHHGFPVPDATAEARLIRVHLTSLANDIDTKMRKITYGDEGTSFPTGARNGDIHLTYIPAAAPAPPPDALDEPDGPGAPIAEVTLPLDAVPVKKTRARKATG